LRVFRDRYRIPVPDDRLAETPFYKPADDSPEMVYMRERRAALGGFLPARRRNAEPVAAPPLTLFQSALDGSGEREISTTMAFVRMLTALVKDPRLGQRVVPIVPDEARTFGMEGLFRQLGIYASEGQLYEPNDSDQIMYYREDRSGQILQEGINEAGGTASWLAAATSYSNHALPLIPFYAFYSMFGFQRVGDLLWAAGDAQARGFLLGGTSGRTTLSGEGLQHQDGHSHLMAATIPNCVSYDPTYAYELAVILHDGMTRMLERQENVFYYVTMMNENYVQPPMPKGVAEGIVRGMYLLRTGPASDRPRVQLMGSGTILREVLAAADLLAADFGVDSDVWSMTSMNELRRGGLDAARWNTLHPTAEPRVSYVGECLHGRRGPAVCATDYIAAYADQIRPFVRRRFKVLGTDGFGRSDRRAKLRHFFEVDRFFVTIAALKALADDGEIEHDVVQRAISKYGIDPAKPNPAKV
jgi:pyruvate dehydrogenase E1 component